MNRRSFFRTVAAAAVVAPVVPTTLSAALGPAATPATRRLVFNRNAFAFTMPPLGPLGSRFVDYFNSDDVLTGRGVLQHPAPRLTLAQIRAYGPPERLPL